MTSDGTPKKFDCVKWTREVRDRIYEETKDMTWEERRRWSESQIRSDPLLAKLFDRMKGAESRNDGKAPIE